MRNLPDSGPAGFEENVQAVAAAGVVWVKVKPCDIQLNNLFYLLIEQISSFQQVGVVACNNTQSRFDR